MTKLNIIIPAFKEASRITNTLTSLSKFLKLNVNSNLDIMTYVINDGSTDDTYSITKDLYKKLTLSGDVLSYDINQGKGYAVKYGMLNSRNADYYYLADADLSASWDTLLELLKVAETSNSDCVIGSRTLKPNKVHTSLFKKIAGRGSNIIINLFLQLGLNDTQCGYKLFNNKCISAFKELTLNRWGFDFELLYIIKKKHLTIKEVSI